MPDIRAPLVLAFFAVAGLAGCARQPAPLPIAAAPAPVPPRPVLEAALGSVVPPPRGADGHYLTINSGADPERAVWHVRAALNVAAIGCRSPADAGITPAYNAMLADKKAVLAHANAIVQAGFQARSPRTWQNDHDSYMTRLYNFFAMPAAKAQFCAAADAIAPQAAATPAAGFPAFAATALPQLEAPFTAVFAAVDGYRTQLAEWDARYGAGAIAPAAAPIVTAAAPVTSRPQLAYADTAPMLAWEPRQGAALALR